MGEIKIYDVIIVGGGPAGLSAALILGRCLRKVIVFDSGKPRNIKSKSLHGFLSRDGINPLELLRIGREQLEKYKIEFNSREIVNAKSLDEVFEVEDQDGNFYSSRKILIATGLIDAIPKIKGIEKFYGSSVFHCPYCDGFEVKFQPIAVVGQGKSGAGLSLALRNWSEDIVLCTNGRKISDQEIEMLKSNDIKIINKQIEMLEGENGLLRRVLFTDRSYLDRSALFFTTDQYQRSNIAAQLGCKFNDKGIVKVGKFQNTSVHGVYVAGDAAGDMQLAMIASADGAKAAVVINQELQKAEKTLKKIDLFL